MPVPIVPCVAAAGTGLAAENYGRFYFQYVYAINTET